MAGAGYKLFGAGDILTAGQVNTYLNEQTVMVFATTAARDAALTSVLAEGMTVTVTADDRLYRYDGTNWRIVGGAMPQVSVLGATDSIANGGGGAVVDLTTGATEIVDTDGFHGASDNIVIPAGLGGDYLCNAFGKFAVNSTGVRQVWFNVTSNSTNGEGNLDVAQSGAAMATLDQSMGVSRIVRLEAGAVLKLKAYQNSGGALNIEAPQIQALMVNHLPALT